MKYLKIKVFFIMFVGMSLGVLINDFNSMQEISKKIRSLNAAEISKIGALLDKNSIDYSHLRDVENSSLKLALYYELAAKETKMGKIRKEFLEVRENSYNNARKILDRGIQSNILFLSYSVLVDDVPLKYAINQFMGWNK